MADSGVGAFDYPCKHRGDHVSSKSHLQVDEDLAGSRFGHIKINDLSRDLARLVVDTCLICAW